MAIDQGSDGLSAVSFLRDRGVNVSVICDWSHGGQNDLYDSLKDLQIYNFWVLCLVVWNVEHGPWNDDMRWSQVLSSWNEATKHFEPTTMPLFVENLPRVIHENGGRDAILQCSEETSVEKVLWEKMSVGWRPKGYKTNLNRFWATRQKAEQFNAWWHMTLSKYSYLCLENGQMSTKKIASLAVKPSVTVSGASEEPTTTDSAKSDAVEKALRCSAQNAIVLSTLILDDYRNCRLVRCIVAGSAHWHAWHQHQNRTQRSSADSLKWMVDQLQGDFGRTNAGTFSVLQDKQSLENIDFDLKAYSKMAATHTARHEYLFLEDDEMADYLGEFVLTLGCRRIARCSFLLLGWPLRIVGTLGCPALQATTVQAFKDDHAAWKALKEQGDSRVNKRYLKRSCFNDVANLQLVQARDV